ncbi:MAG TPA: YidC/Oxa1 family insertase periplasmic-domain containing protein [Sedimentisphaerales bacterium]|nr:YidC/Oxa1 family insertase periplasmic-domain containing protein [Sedimentisphaerales bacterium]
MRYLILVVAGFCLFCGLLVVESGLFDDSSQTGRGIILLQNVAVNEKTEIPNVTESNSEQLEAVDSITFTADNAPARAITLGSVDPKSGYKYQLELSSQGAAIRKAAFSEFDDRDYKNPQPLVIISPIQERDGSEILAMANTNLVFVKQELQLPLNRLDWKSFDAETADDGSSQTARFETIIKREDTGEPALKLTKIYKISRDSYLLDCDVTVENLVNTEQNVRLNMAGPSGLGREAIRTDMRKVVAAFRDSKGQISSVKLDKKKLSRAKSLNERQLKKPGGNFLWIAAVNKYFAAILVPRPDEGKDYCSWITSKTGRFYNPDGDLKADTGDEMLGLDLTTATSTLAATGQADSSKTYNFQLYIGPKDKSLFDKNEMYRKLGFLQTIDFMGCCCPAKIISPLAFGILALMKWMYGFIPNYGVVIIILVFLMRLCMHPITKKSQVSMSKMSTLAPKAEEIKKKYANNKAEMNKQMMALYREQGASPIMGFLPMMVQMPIWIALWSAVYASIDLRGAAFLPFWITDLSVPDALVRFSTLTMPLLGWKIESLNLLPLLMGVAFYLQQQLMPSQANASTNPQMAQQQKMMKIMMPLLFPLMLYKAPSGVNLYIMASTFAGVIEQYVIRKHIREKEQAESEGLVAATSKTGGKVKKKKPKPFFRNM